MIEQFSVISRWHSVAVFWWNGSWLVKTCGGKKFVQNFLPHSCKNQTFW